MGYIIDLVLIAVCVLIICISWKRGLIRSVMGLIKGVVSILISYAFTPILSNILYTEVISDLVTESVKNDIVKNTAGSGGFDLAKLLSDLPEWFSQMINRYGAESGKLTENFGNITNGSDGDVTALSKVISDSLAGTISTVAAFIILFAASFIVLTVVTIILDKIFKLPLLNGMNKFGGLLFGIVEAFVMVSLAGLLLSKLVVSLGSVNTGLFGEGALDNSVILKFLSTHNILEFIGKVIG